MISRFCASLLLLCVACCAAESESAPREKAFRVRATGQVDADNWTPIDHGTGSAIDCTEFGLKEPRYILTCAHVVNKKGRTFSIEISDGRWIACEAVLIDEECDLALLKASEDLPAPAKLAPAEKMKTSGSPEGKPVIVAAAAVKRLGVELPMAHGMSGGPIYNAKGELAGVIMSGVSNDEGKTILPNVCVAISADCVRLFLESVKK